MDQKLEDYEIIVVDSGSSDNNLSIISNLQKKSKKIKLIAEKDNIGLSKAYNLGISQAVGEYLFVMNHDFLVEDNSIQLLYEFIESNQSVGAVMGKIKRYDFETNKKTNLIDSCGIEFYRNRRFKDIGEGQIDGIGFTGISEIFGVSGAGALYRKEALESIKFEDEYFDEDFFMYKDDIDLSWRLRWKGWKLFSLRDVIFWHGRTSGGVNEKVKGIFHRTKEVIKNEKKKPLYIKKLSYRNQILLFLKNESIPEIIKSFI